MESTIEELKRYNDRKTWLPLVFILPGMLFFLSLGPNIDIDPNFASFAFIIYPIMLIMGSLLFAVGPAFALFYGVALVNNAFKMRNGISFYLAMAFYIIAIFVEVAYIAGSWYSLQQPSVEVSPVLAGLVYGIFDCVLLGAIILDCRALWKLDNSRSYFFSKAAN